MRFLSIRTLVLSLVASAVVTAGVNVRAQNSSASNDVKSQSDTTTAGTETAKKPLTEKEQKQRRKAFKEEIDSAYRTWLNEDVRWIITGEEEQAFKLLGTDEERDQFIEQFWLRRDPTPDTVENEFKEEHYRRIAYANEHYASGVPGWKTDRGHVYITWGPPDEVESHPSGGTYNREISEGGGTTSTYPFEKWRYRHIDNIGEQVILEFVDQCMCSNYKLSTDPNDKDALKNVPGAGLTMYEEMGMASKADRITGITGVNPYDSSFASRRFDQLELMAKINAAPPIKFKDLDEIVTHHITYNLMPFDVRTDFVKLTNDMILVPITIQMKNKDITFIGKDGLQTGTVNIFGRVTTLTGRVAQTFEDTVSQQVPQDLMEKQLEQQSVYWKALPLRPGQYKLDIVLKDVNGDRRGTYTRGFRVQQYPEEKLATSSLILADVMEHVAAKTIGAGNFVIGNTKVRPRVEPANGKPVVFKKNQKLNLWMQVYNLQMDEKSKKPSATVEYELVNAQTNKSVFKQTESTDTMGNVGAQITLEKSMPLASLDPGLYRITIKVDDNVSKQTINPSARFMVE